MECTDLACFVLLIKARQTFKWLFRFLHQCFWSWISQAVSEVGYHRAAATMLDNSTGWMLSLYFNLLWFKHRHNTEVNKMEQVFHAHRKWLLLIRNTNMPQCVAVIDHSNRSWFTVVECSECSESTNKCLWCSTVHSFSVVGPISPFHNQFTYHLYNR